MRALRQSVGLRGHTRRVNAYTLFDTAIGTCGIAWSGVGVVAFALPEATEAETEDRFRRVIRASQQ